MSLFFDLTFNKVQGHTFFLVGKNFILNLSELLEHWWTEQFNKLFAREYGLRSKLPSVFIDTYYDKDSPYELKKFTEETNELFEFATNRNPFECKDIEIALTDIMKLNKEIDTLKQDGQNKVNTIQQLLEENLKLNASLRGLQFIPR